MDVYGFELSEGEVKDLDALDEYLSGYSCVKSNHARLLKVPPIHSHRLGRYRDSLETDFHLQI